MIRIENFIITGVFILLVLMLFNLFNIFGLKSEITQIREATKPAELELVIIKTDCADCFNINDIIENLKNSNIKVVKEVSLGASSDEAKIMVDEYKIEKLPTIVLKGDVEKVSIQGFKREGDVLIFTDVKPPYVSPEGEVIGKVSAIIIKESGCDVCYDFNGIVQNLQQSGVVFSDIKTIELNSSDAEQLIAQYEIKKVPVILLSTDIDAYPVFQNLKSGVTSKNGYYLIESQAPYVEANTGRIRGIVSLTMITDESCNECYDVNLHKQVLARFSLAIGQEETVDVSSPEGKELIEKYNITKVPTIVLTGDVSIYEIFNNVWEQVGTIENGAYIFRETDVMGTYKDLSTNEVIGK